MQELCRIEGGTSEAAASLAAAVRAVAPGPKEPWTSAYLFVLPIHGSNMPDDVLGVVVIAPSPIAMHVHTMRCITGIYVEFADHSHSPFCNHSPANRGEAWIAARSGNYKALTRLLSDEGASTEERDDAASST